LVVGYETDHKCQDGLKSLEMELAYLGGTCAAALMRKNLSLSMPSGEDPEEEDMELAEESASEAYEMHTALLSKGFALERPPSVHQVCI
jgi:E3 ubiquitin-protein ligase MYCBP2